MEVKPGYKQTEVGVIPEEWDVKSLGEIGEALIGLTYKPTDVRQHGTLVLRSSNIQNDALAFDDNVFVDAAIPERIRVLNDDVLICVRNGSRDLIGKSALLDDRTKGMTFGAFMAVYRSQIGRLASYLFQSAILKRQINEHLGATINQITNKSINSFRIPVPTPPEQRAIAMAFSDVDELLGGLDRLIAKKRDHKQAAMQQLLTGQTRLPGFHDEWEVKRLGDIFEITSSKRVFQSEWKSSGVPFYRAREVAVLGETGQVDNDLFITKTLYDSFKTAHGVPEIGDILVTGVGTLGKVYVVRNEEEFYFKDGNIIWFKIRGAVSAEFLRQLYLTKVVMKQITDGSAGTTVGTYTITGAKNTEIPFPPLSEQIAIAEALADMDAELAALDLRREKIRALKQAMMQELLTGKVRLI